MEKAKEIRDELKGFCGVIKGADEYLEFVDKELANIAYSSIEHIAKYEGYYVSVFYAFLYSMGLDVIQEDITNNGRIDLTIIIND